jgi:deazaflavin-dependent oxidoreductase (nitroreductase family)
VPGLGFDALVLTTIGRTSGLERPTPVGWFLGQDDSRLIVASAIGAARNPAWYDNLAAHPDQVWIETPAGPAPASPARSSACLSPGAWPGGLPCPWN